MRKYLTNILNILLPLLLGGAILYWMYRGFDFERVQDALLHEVNWWWMAFSLVFGVLAQVFRGLRWKQTLEPLGEYPKTMNCIHAVFISYTTSLVVPRSGEVVRCGVLSRYDGTSFPKAIGTVVTERVIDSLLLIVMTLIVFLLQIKTFIRFFDETGTSLTGWLQTFTTTGYIVTAACVVVTIAFLWYFIRKATIFAKLRKIISDIKDAGIPLTKDKIFGGMSNRTRPVSIFKWVSVAPPEMVKEADESNIHHADVVGMYVVELGVYKRHKR